MHDNAPLPWVTIVSGLPRSGTSMMMQMLAAGGMSVLVDGLRAADEDNLRGYLEFEPVKRTREDPSWVSDAVGKAVKMVYLLLYDLPREFQYRVLLMERPMDEVLASQREMLKRRGQAGANLAPAQMADAFARQREKVESWLREQANFRTLSVKYHDVLARPADQVERINRFLDARLDQAAMIESVDPRLHRQKS
jgi:hypothetical protein